MNFSVKTILFFLMISVFVLTACRESAPKKISDEGLTIPEFLKIAPTLSLPVTINEEDLSARRYDSGQVHIPTFRTYFSDSVYHLLFGNKPNLKISVIGKVVQDDQATYLLVRKIAGKHKAILVLYLNSKGSYAGHLVLLDSKNKRPGEICSAKFDTKFNISLITEKQTSNDDGWTGEKIFYFDASGIPIMAVTNTNKDLSNEILGNPIDSLSRKNKHAGDYSTDKKNLVSIRDGRTEKTMLFFIHFSKRQGNCVGELKGEADWVNKNFAVFRDNKSPCIIEFKFSGNRVSFKETGGCGSYRDIKCTFEGSYPKVKKMLLDK